MARWRVPKKVLLPAEPDFPQSSFEFNGRLANGDQVMAYIGSRSGQTHPPSSTPFTRHTAIVFRFNADGALLTVDFATTAHGGDYVEKDADRSWQKARDLLSDLLSPVQSEGWVSADIRVRPFYVIVDDLETGLVYQTDGEDESEEEEDFQDYSSECVRLVPFDIFFHRPWTDGNYDT